MHVAPAKMLLQVLLTRESVPCASIAVRIGAHERLLGIDVLLMHLALMSQQATGICKPLDLIASGLQAFVRAVVLVHVFAIRRSVLSSSSPQH
jgi:hypothetical protein